MALSYLEQETLTMAKAFFRENAKRKKKHVHVFKRMDINGINDYTDDFLSGKDGEVVSLDIKFVTGVYICTLIWQG